MPVLPVTGELTTVGHGTLDLDGLGALLATAGIGLVVDVRRFPASRRHPHLGLDVLQPALAALGIGYRWDERLGGRRPPGPADGPDSWWSVPAFRGYAAHTRTLECEHALDDLVADLDRARVAVMCSESVWWRCHRRLVADVVVAVRGRPARHLMPSGSLVTHRVSAGARVRQDGRLVWDGARSP